MGTQTKGPGSSENTPIKQRHFRQIVATHLRICQSILKKNPQWLSDMYHYIDAYGGSGSGPGGSGSPVIFCEESSKLRIKSFALVHEINDDARFSLHTKMFPYRDDVYVLIKEDCRSLEFRDNSKKRLGMLYADPNGLPHWDVLQKAFDIKANRMLDLVLHLPGTMVKRCVGMTCHKSLGEHLSAIDKQFWIVREPYGSWHWTFVIGTNWDAFPKFSHIGFHRIDSPKGAEIFEQIHYTKEQLVAMGKKRIKYEPKQCQLSLAI